MKQRSAEKFGCRRLTARWNWRYPPGTNSGRTFRLKGKGLKSKSAAGDLLATVRIMLPERSDDEFKELMRQWRENKPYDPRKDLELTAPAREAVVRYDFRPVNLLPDRPGDCLQPVMVGRSAHDIGDLIVDPIKRGFAASRRW